ncbi:MAG: sugar phosphate isomerase/epimerase [Candidatus Hydrogenedens sp.]|nr:sugar phosphate isomerase/epimerase [Candidatus Hydrogenedentota bacterium]NLF57996.1 sugar phosphate isomerase/epimerase [Candidatus Hydrogenedens sp.]
MWTKGINQWVFPAGTPVERAMEEAAQAGFEAFEVCFGPDGPLPLEMTGAEAAALRRHAESLGLALSSVASGMGWQFPLSSPDPAVRERGLETNRRMLQLAAWLGADTLLVVPGLVTPEVSYDEALETALASVRLLADTAESLGVGIGVENVWNKFLLSPVEMRDFIDHCESPRVGAYVDTGNMMPYGYPEQYLRILGRRVLKVHAKDFRVSAGNLDGFVMLLEGDVDWPAVAAALRDMDYNGPMTAEIGPYRHGGGAQLRQISTALDAIREMA